METNFSKSEKVIATVALVTISAFFALFLHVNRGTKTASQNEISINYEMARPDQVYSEYDLSGRELDQSYEALAKKAAKKAQEAKKTEDAKKKALIAKQKEANKKQAELKKKQQQAAQRTQFAKKQQQILQAQAQAARQAADAAVNREPQQSAYAGNGTYGANGGSPAAAAEEQKKNDKKKTFAEWRTLLLASPTAENLAQFVAAFRNSDITADEFQAMAQDLLTQTDNRYKTLGLMALRSVPSLASLSQLVHLDAAVIAGYQSYVNQSVNAYLQTQNLPYLNQALRTSDKLLVLKVLNLLNENLVKLNEGDTSIISDPRSRGTVSAFSMNDYLPLVPNLKLLVASPDTELAALAQSAASIIQSSNNVARN